MKLREMFEGEQTASSVKTIGISFGRFNPPHKGHKGVWKAASKNPIWYVGTNDSTAGPKDPLPYDIKLQCMAAVFPPVAGHVVPEQSLLTLATSVYNKYGENVHLKVYTDETWLADLLVKYNGAESEHGMYKFKNIEHVPTERLASATDLRAAVRSGDRESFYHDMGIGSDVTIEVGGNAKPIFDVVAHYLNQYPEKVKKAVKAKEDAAGVGIITKQNSTIDVNKNTPKKNLRAFRLAEQIKEMERELQEGKSGKFKNIMKHSGIEARRYDSADTYYDMYRLGIAMASDGTSASRGMVGDSPSVWIRNDVEAAIVDKAEKDVGKKGTRIIPKGPSEETNSVNTASPVATPKRNQYGV